MTENDITKLIEAMKPVVAAKEDLEQFPTAEMVQRGFDGVDKRFDKVEERLDRIENLMLADHKRRIEKLEQDVKDLKNALAM